MENELPNVSGNSTKKHASICKVADIAMRMDVSARQRPETHCCENKRMVPKEESEGFGVAESVTRS